MPSVSQLPTVSLHPSSSSPLSHLDAHLGHGLDLSATRRRGATALDNSGQLRIAGITARVLDCGLLLRKELEQRETRLLALHRRAHLLHESERRLSEACAIGLTVDSCLRLLVC